MTEIDVEHMRGWIGKTETAADTVAEGLVAKFRASLGERYMYGNGVPLAFHWCLSRPAFPAEALGEDGTPRKDGFFPPVPLPRRMWAGGKIEVVDAFQVNDTVKRTSKIADVSVKTGGAGKLVFVNVDHEITTGRGPAMRERHDIVYLEARPPGAAPAPPPPKKDGPKAAHTETFAANSILLFRYSALTFNSHRIHYDRDYARDVEGYSGLVVHGPLQATLLLNYAARLNGKSPKTFSYRGVSPLFDTEPFTLNASETADGLQLWTANPAGVTAMTASATW